MPISYPIILPQQGIRSIEMIMDNVNAMAESPFTLTQQVQTHQGQRWRANVGFPPMKQNGYADDMAAALASLCGIRGTFLLGDSSRKTPRGTALAGGGTFPRYLSGSGTSISTNGWGASQAGLLLPGDYFQIGGHNLILRSEEFGSSPWGAGGTVTVTSNTVAGPDAATTADTLAGGASGGYLLQSVVEENGAPLSFSIWVKAPSGTVSMTVSIQESFTSTLVTAAVTATTTWQKITVSLPNRRLVSSVDCIIGGIPASASVYVARAQLNTGLSAQPYVATTSAAVRQTARLHKITRATYADSGGDATLEFWPRLRETYSALSEIKTTSAQGTFRLASNDAGWSVDPAKIYSMGISAVEAIE